MSALQIRSLRITDEEYARQRRLAKEQGLPWSIWARRALATGAPPESQALEAVVLQNGEPCTNRVAVGAFCKECQSVH